MTKTHQSIFFLKTKSNSPESNQRRIKTHSVACMGLLMALRVAIHVSAMRDKKESVQIHILPAQNSPTEGVNFTVRSALVHKSGTATGFCESDILNEKKADKEIKVRHRIIICGQQEHSSNWQVHHTIAVEAARMRFYLGQVHRNRVF